MLKSLEHHEHAEHMAHEAAGHGHEAGDHAGKPHFERSSQMAALLVAILAAALAITEQGAKHAEIRVQVKSVLATDAWAQYQAKSTRGTFSSDLSALVGVMEPGDAALSEKRKVLLERLKADQDRFEKDPKDGKRAIAERARAFEEERDYSLEQTHAYHNGAAALELGIVLSTASAITKSKMLIYMALGLGVAGVIFALLGWVAPEYGVL
jgi:Domain of unknown function (DUF4337)